MCSLIPVGGSRVCPEGTRAKSSEMLDILGQRIHFLVSEITFEGTEELNMC